MYGYGFRPNNKMFGGGATPNPLWDGLLAYYTADNTPNDALGTYNGTLINGATYATGKINNGFSLDGVNDYVNVGNAFDTDGSTPFTLVSWVNASVLSGFKYIIGTQGDGSYKGLGICFSGSNIRVYLTNTLSSNELRVETVNPFSTSIWYNVVVTYDGSKSSTGLKIYVNGVLQSLTVIANNLTGSISFPNKSLIGARNVSNSFFNGIIDEIGWFNVEKTSGQAIEFYNSGAGKQYPN